MIKKVTRNDIFGFVKPSLDAHTLGLCNAEQLLNECGIHVCIADTSICDAVSGPYLQDHFQNVEDWIREEKISRIGFSYRLDPAKGAELFNKFYHQLTELDLLENHGGPLKGIYFAGLPLACNAIKKMYQNQVEVFYGDETYSETMDKLGIDFLLRPQQINEEVQYDTMRLEFAKRLIEREEYRKIEPVVRSGYNNFGTPKDTIIERLSYSAQMGLPPIMRAHAGPYFDKREFAVSLFLDWAKQLARSGFLDVLSIGTSQLSQSNFGEKWENKPNGGGVPINFAEEFKSIYEAAYPMLVRTYAGTTNIPQLARMYEATINIAWHALSFWWFSQLDGRGPYSVLKNLGQHLETLKFIAEYEKPFEPNTPHHFAFRGADDLTYIVSAVLAAKTAKLHGVKYLILQNMLNTPKSTWGIQDLAKSRALLSLIRALEDKNFRVFFQPRAGLDYLSHDIEKAKMQLAAVSALMDDVEPHNTQSPPVIHVVSYTEGDRFADPQAINESIQITRAAIDEYRKQRDKGNVGDMTENPEVNSRKKELLNGADKILKTMETTIPNLYTAKGLYKAFWAGFLPVPYLWACRDEFPFAVNWETRSIKGSVKVVNEKGQIITPEERTQIAAETVRTGRFNPEGNLEKTST